MKITKNGSVVITKDGDIEVNDFCFDADGYPACYVKMAELATEYAISMLNKNLNEMRDKKDTYSVIM